MPDTTAAPPKPKRSFSERKVQSLALKGVSDNDIARMQDVEQSTISRYLNTVMPDRGVTLDTFKQHRADILAHLHKDALAVKQRIIASLRLDPLLDALKPSEKANLLRAINESGGTDYDKERLERGLSTVNESVMLKVMGEAQKAIYSDIPAHKVAQPIDKTEG